MKIAKNNYQKILVKVQQEIQKTQKNIVQTVNQQKVEMCWQIGKIIEEHLLQNQRAEYGKNFFKNLATDTKIAEKALYQMRAFYKAYPQLPKEEAALSWSHYRNLSSIKDEEQRKQLEDLTKTQNLDGEELRQKISQTKSNKKAKPTKLKVVRGRLFTYKNTEKDEIDLGFNIFLSPSTASVILKAQKTEIVDTKKSDYTYLAKLERVVDGDTIHAELDLGFGIKHHEILRLAQINAAEATTKEGEKSTAALKEILKNTDFLIVKTSKTDIYGRYIADVFFDESGKKSDPQEIAKSGIYLNQLLLDRGVVERY